MCLAPKILPEADSDIDTYSNYIAERNLSASWRFADAVDATIQMLLRNPELGERVRSDPTGQIRYRTISGFKNYPIFYRRMDSVLEIIRVLHGAQDYDGFFD